MDGVVAYRPKPEAGVATGVAGKECGSKSPGFGGLEEVMALLDAECRSSCSEYGHGEAGTAERTTQQSRQRPKNEQRRATLTLIKLELAIQRNTTREPK